jgi:hypothetical protein
MREKYSWQVWVGLGAQPIGSSDRKGEENIAATD